MFLSVEGSISILKMMPNYLLRRNNIFRLHTIHNFIRREARRDRLFEEFKVQDLELVDEQRGGTSQQTPEEDMT